MLMAERAADCLAKLGLENVHSNNSSNSINTSPISSTQSQIDGFKSYQSPSHCYSSASTVNVKEPLRVLGGRVSPTISFSMLSSSSDASIKQSNNKLQLGNCHSQPQPNIMDSNNLFNSHHRR